MFKYSILHKLNDFPTQNDIAWQPFHGLACLFSDMFANMSNTSASLPSP